MTRTCLTDQQLAKCFKIIALDQKFSGKTKAALQKSFRTIQALCVLYDQTSDESYDIRIDILRSIQYTAQLLIELKKEEKRTLLHSSQRVSQTQ